MMRTPVAPCYFLEFNAGMLSVDSVELVDIVSMLCRPVCRIELLVLFREVHFTELLNY